MSNDTFMRKTGTHPISSNDSVIEVWRKQKWIPVSK